MSLTRRPRGSLTNAVPLGYRIDVTVKKRLDDMARDSGVTGALMLEYILAHIEIDDSGTPLIWQKREQEN